MHTDWQFLWDAIWNFFAGHMGELVSGFGGALMGALAAYSFERHKENTKENEDMRSSIRFAQLTLICHVNWLLGARKFLDPFRQTDARETKISHFYHTPNQIRLDLRSLSFVLDHEANLLMELYTADSAYQSATETLVIRNQHLTDFQSRARIEHFDLETGAATVEASLPHLKVLRDITDALYRALDDAITDNNAAILKLKAFGKRLFPKHKFLSVENQEEKAPNEKPGT